MRLKIVLAALGVASVAVLATGCAEMHKSAAAKAPAARVANTGQGENLDAIKKLPDWSGVWEPMLFAAPKKGAPPPVPPAQPQLTPAYAKKYAAFQAKAKKTKGIAFVTDAANCVPYGMPTSMREPYPIEFLYTPGRVTVLIETDFHRPPHLHGWAQNAGRSRSDLSGLFDRTLGR